MKAHSAAILFGLAVLAAVLAGPVQAQVGPPPNVLVPPSNARNPLEQGLRFQTNYRVLLTPGGGLGPAGGMTPA
ncbi:MAG: hypothetical protein KA354_06410 [Phycisphaerae bacterium]|nr:hypothetical protein [Phycisphaerae bacterium]